MITGDTVSADMRHPAERMPRLRAILQSSEQRAYKLKLLALAVTLDFFITLAYYSDQQKSSSPADTAVEASVVTHDDKAPVQGEDGQQLRRLSVKVTERGLLLDGRPVSASELIAQARAEKAVKVSLHVGSDVHSIRQEDLKVMLPLNAAGFSVNVVFNQM